MPLYSESVRSNPAIDSDAERHAVRFRSINPGKLLADLKGFDHYLLKPFDPAELLALLAPLIWPDRDRLDEA
jgi:CheY-like chemotaxis protein